MIWNGFSKPQHFIGIGQSETVPDRDPWVLATRFQASRPSCEPSIYPLNLSPTTNTSMPNLLALHSDAQPSQATEMRWLDNKCRHRVARTSVLGSETSGWSHMPIALDLIHVLSSG